MAFLRKYAARSKIILDNKRRHTSAISVVTSVMVVDHAVVRDHAAYKEIVFTIKTLANI